MHILIAISTNGIANNFKFKLKYQKYTETKYLKNAKLSYLNILNINTNSIYTIYSFKTKLFLPFMPIH